MTTATIPPYTLNTAKATLHARFQRQLPEPPMSLEFYERVGHEGRRPSPFSWRIRYALAHKGVDFEVRPTRFADVETIRALTGQHMTPVLVDGGCAVHDTWEIACHLEERFPDHPLLFG